MELTTEQKLTAYLPYKVGLYIEKNVCLPYQRNVLHKKGSVITLDYSSLGLGLDFLNAKVILRSISDITEDIIYNGKVVNVSEIIFPKEDDKTAYERNINISALKLESAVQFSCTK